MALEPWISAGFSRDLCRILALKVLGISLSPKLTLQQESDDSQKEFTAPKAPLYWALVTKMHSRTYLGRNLNTLKDTGVILHAPLGNLPNTAASNI